MTTSVRSYAKINLGLAIGPTRADGFHALTTLYQTIGINDIVTVSAQSVEKNSACKSLIQLTSNHAKVPLNSINTAWKMVDLVLRSMKISAKVEIHIQKNLPIQGGLGAGSANAAAALIALEAELNQALPPAQRLAIAAEVGSDVPLFLLGGTVLGQGRGEQVFPLPDLPQLPCIVVVPPVGVSTPQAFKDWDNIPQNKAADGLTTGSNSDRLNKLSRVLASVYSPSGASGVLPIGQGLAGNPLLALVRTGIENDFEQVVFPLHTSLRAIKRLLFGSSTGEGQAVYAALSGSGSALFGLYHNLVEAEAAKQRVLEFAATELPGTEVLLTSTISRDMYWREIAVKN